MTISARVSRVALGVLLAVSGRMAFAAEPAKVDAKAAFARLKTLSGDWKVTEGPECQTGPGAGKIVYKVTSGGNTLMETMAPGSETEMVSMYHIVGDDLVMTHFCALGNQPRMKLDLAASTPDNLVFAFDGGSNFDPAEDMHVHSGAEIHIVDGKKVESTWEAYAGKKATSSKTTMIRSEK